MMRRTSSRGRYTHFWVLIKNSLSLSFSRFRQFKKIFSLNERNHHLSMGVANVLTGRHWNDNVRSDFLFFSHSLKKRRRRCLQPPETANYCSGECECRKRKNDQYEVMLEHCVFREIKKEMEIDGRESKNGHSLFKHTRQHTLFKAHSHASFFLSFLE